MLTNMNMCFFINGSIYFWEACLQREWMPLQMSTIFGCKTGLITWNSGRQKFSNPCTGIIIFESNGISRNHAQCWSICLTICANLTDFTKSHTILNLHTTLSNKLIWCKSLWTMISLCFETCSERHFWICIILQHDHWRY